MGKRVKKQIITGELELKVLLELIERERRYVKEGGSSETLFALLYFKALGELIAKHNKPWIRGF